MASEQEVVSGGNGKSVSHESRRVDAKGGGHLSGDQIRALLSVQDGGNGNAKVGYRSPEVSRADIAQHRVGPDLGVDGLCEGSHFGDDGRRDGFRGREKTLGLAAEAIFS